MDFLHCLFIAILITMLLAVSVIGSDQKDEPAKQETDLSTGRTLYMVGYAHLDTQWQWDYPDVLKRCIPDTLNGNFRLFEMYPNYIFNFSGSNRYRMIKEYYPSDYEKLKQYVAEGRWFPCGSSVEECDVNVPSAESIIRQVLYGNHYFRTELGKDSAEFMLPDCFGFPASLPSLLAHCGLKGFSTQKLSWGSAEGIPFNVGLWEGLDGVSLIAALNAGDYCKKIKENLSISDDWAGRIDENGKTSNVFADYQYFGSPGDEGGAPTDETVDWVEKSAATDGPVHVISSNADQMFLDITPEQAKGLPRYKGDLLLVEHSAGSITSQGYMKRWNRMNELLADSAERASIAAEWLGGLTYPQKKLNDAWTLVMGGQFHDILPGTSLPICYEYSWNDEVLAMNQFASVLEHAVGSIASGLDTSAGGKAVVVYNPLSIEREEVVEATVTFSKPAGAVKVVGPDGKQALSQIISAKNGQVKLLFLAKVPSVGFAVYDVQPTESSASRTTELAITKSSLENGRYRVKLDANGDVAGIYDKLAKREMLSAPVRLAFTYDNPAAWPAWNIDWDNQNSPPRAYVEGPAKVKIVEKGPVRVALEIEREAEGSKFIQTIRLSAGGAGDRVEFADKIDWHSSECNLKVVVPTAVSNPLATYNWEVGTIQRGNNEPKKYEVPSHQWFDLTDVKGDYGVTVLSPFKYGSDKPNDNTLRLTLLRTPGVQGGFEDEASQDWGRHDIAYGLAGHISDWRAGQTDWQAMRLEQPLIAFQSTSHAGKLGKTFSLVKVSDPRVRVMAVKKAEDSDDVIIRIVELGGKPAKDVRVSFAAPVTSAREVNGQEQTLGDAKVVEGQLAIDMSAYNLRSFAIKLAKSSTRLDTPHSQPVTIAYNSSVATCDKEKSVSGFDSDGRSLAAEMLPGKIVDGDVTFELAPAGNGQKNALTCKGQTISLPGGEFNRIALLIAASKDQPATFEVDGKKIELTIQDWGGYVGQWDNRIWKDGSDNWTERYAGLDPGYTKRAPVAWFCSHRHNSDGENEPYVYSYLYTYSIDAPSGAKTLKLPNNPNIRVLAISVSEDTTNGCQPAQPLYDTLEDHKTIAHK